MLIIEESNPKIQEWFKWWSRNKEQFQNIEGYINIFEEIIQNEPYNNKFKMKALNDLAHCSYQVTSD